MNPNKITSKTIKQYQNLLAQMGVSESTIKRKLASLRRFSSWLTHEGYLKENPFIQKSSPISNFKFPISKAKLTFRAYRALPYFTYLNFLILLVFLTALGWGLYQQFVVRAPSPLAYPAAETRPKRYLSFQGRLTDSSYTPIVTAVNMEFKLYNAAGSGTPPIGGTLLWQSGVCSVDPDQDGIFAILLGTTSGTGYTCASAIEIPSSVFSENAEVWLETKVVSETLSPRIQIATVAYALNAETLQGFPLASAGSTTPEATMGATARTVPAINPAGNLVIAASSPTLWSTSGTFGIKGQAISIQTDTGTGGNITLAPDGTGVLNIVPTSGNQIGGTINATNSALTTGALYTGRVENNNTGYDFLRFFGGTSPVKRFSVGALGSIDMENNLDVGGAATITGTLAANGAIISNLVPSGTRNLGSSGSNWDYLYVNNLDTFTLQGAISGNDQSINNLATLQTNTIEDNDDTTLSVNDNLSVIGNVVPSAGNTYDLGSSGAYWNNLYANNIYGGTSGTSGYWTKATGLIYPNNTYESVAVGGTSTASAKLYFEGTTGNASMSGALTLHSTGTNYINALSGQALSLRTSVGGDAGLTDRLYITNAGNVGIGTTAPTNKLHIKTGDSDLYSMVETTYVAGNSGYRMKNTTQEWRIGVVGSDSDKFTIRDNTGTAYQPVVIEPDAGNNLLYLKQGKVGIGTTAPTAILDIAGDASTSGSLVFRGTSPATIDILNGDDLRFQTSVGGDAVLSPRMTITNAGNVGIGTTGPSDLLHLEGGAPRARITGTVAGSNVGYRLFAKQPTGGLTRSSGYYFVPGDTDATTYLGLSADDTNYQLVVTRAGNVGIGTTGPGSPLTISKDISAGSGAKLIDLSGSTLGTDDYAIYLNSLGYWKSVDATGHTYLMTGNLKLRYGYLYSPWDDVRLDVGSANTTLRSYTDGNLTLQALGTGDILLSTDSDTDVNIGSGQFFVEGNTGEVGIGTTDPGSKLQVAGNITPTVTSTYDLGSSSLYWNNLYANNIYGGTGGTQGYWTKATGLIYPNNTYESVAVGGTSTASAKLYFEGTTGNASMSGTLTLGQGQTIRPAYGPLQLAYKSGPNAWTTGMVINESGNVGIGTTGPSYKLDVSGTLGVSGVSTFLNKASLAYTNTDTAGNALVFYHDVTPPAATVNVFRGIQGFVRLYGSNNFTGTQQGFQGGVLNYATGTVANIQAGSFYNYNTTATTITNSSILDLITYNDNASGIITNSYGINVHLDVNTGTITKTYGVYVGDITTGTQTNTPFSFYASDANAYNYFAGNVGIGTTTPLGALHIDKNTSVNPALIVNQLGSGNIIEASSSGTRKFFVTNDGSLNSSGYATISGSLAVGYSSVLAGTGNAAFAGKVGIGTTAPSRLLHVAEGAGSYSAEFDGDVQFDRYTHFRGTGMMFGAGDRDYGGLVHGADDGTRFLVGIDTFGNRNIIITDSTNWIKDHDHDTLSANPTLFIHSVTDPDSDNTQWLSLAHDQTNAQILTGAGDIVLDPAGGDVVVDGDVLPNTGDTYDLGSTTAYWNNLYVNNLFGGTSGTQGHWSKSNGLIYPNNTYESVAIGGTSTTSAKLYFEGTTGNASMSGNLTLAGGGTIGATDMNNLTIGDANTNNVQFYSGSYYLNPSGQLTLATNETINGIDITSGAITDLTGLTFDGSARTITNANQLTLSTSGASSNLVLSAGRDITFDDDNLTSAIPLSVGDTSLNANLTQGIIDAINEAYDAAVGSGGISGFWTKTSGLLFPNNTYESVAIGGTATSSAKLYFEGTTGNASMAGTLTIGQGQTIRPAYGPLQLAYKSGPNAWTTGMVMNESGNVGIGTTGPTALLHLSSTATIDLFRVDDNGAGDTSPFVITADGKVGIGTTSPAQKLEVVGAIRVSSATSNIDIYGSGTNANLIIDPYGGNTIFNTGNVGIGTTSPVAPLHISKGYGSNAALIVDQLFSGDILTASASGQTKFTVSNSGNLTFSGSANTITNANQLTLSTTGASSDLVLSAGRDITFDDDNLSSPVPLSVADSALNASLGQGIIDAINDAYEAAIGSGGISGFWTKTSGLLFPNNTYESVAVGGTSTSSAKLYFEGTTGNASMSGTLTIGQGQTIRPAYGPLQLAYKSGPNAWTTGMVMTGSGYVGIGTTGPGTKLELSTVGDTSVHNILTLRSATGKSSLLSFYSDNNTYQTTFGLAGAAGAVFSNSTAGDFTIRAPDNKLLLLGVDNGAGSNTAAVAIQESGNVGIGTTTPTAKLDVAGDASTSGSLVFRGTSPATIDILNGDDLRFQTSVGGDAVLTPRMTITNAGNVGIGTTSPFGLGGTASLTMGPSGTISWKYDSGQANSRAWGIRTDKNSWGDFQILTTDAQDEVLDTARLVINPSGNVGIGTTNPSAKLDIVGDLEVNGYATVSSSLALGTSSAPAGPGNLALSGKITSGTWNGTAIGTQYGGTGQNWSATAQGSIPYFNGIGTMDALAPSTAGYVLTTQGASANPTWTASSGLGTNYWTKTTGLIYPNNTYESVAVGGTSTASAKLYFEGTTGNASMAGTLTIGQGQTIRPAYGPLQLAYKSGPNAWTTGMVITEQGYVGIGTTSPQSKLQVRDVTSGQVQLQISNNYTSPNTGPSVALSFRGWRDVDTNQEVARIESIIGDSEGNNLASKGDLRFYTAEHYNTLSEKMRITYDGNVGIGTTGPTNRLEVIGPNVSTGTSVIYANTDTDGNGGSQLYLSRNSNTTWWGQANVKLGTSTSYWLTGLTPSCRLSGTCSTGTSDYTFYYGTSTYPTHVMTLQSGGNVGIGTTNPEDLLEIQGAEGIDAILTLDADDGDDAADTWEIRSEATGNDLSIVNDATEVMNLTSGGNLQIDGDLAITGGNITTAVTADSTLTVTGTLTANGDVDLGNATSDTITATGRFDSSLVPSATSTYDLGSSSLYWNNLYANNIYGGTGGTQGYWTKTTGLIYPNNTYESVAVGGTATTSAKLYFEGTTGNASISGQLTLHNTGTNYINALSGQALSLRTSAGGDAGLTDRLYITNGGNVGIGTTNLQGKLDVAGTMFTSDYSYFGGTVNTGLRLKGTDNTNTIYQHTGNMGLTVMSGNAITFNSAVGTEVMRIISGNVGIGTTNPEDLLEIQGAEGIDAILTLDADDGDDTTDTWELRSEATGNDLSIRNNDVEVLNLTTAGDLQIDGDLAISGGNITTAVTADSTLTVTGTLTANGDVDLGNATSDTITATGRFDSSLVPSTTSTYDLGSSSLYWNNLYANNIYGGTGGTQGYWTKATGLIYPNNPYESVAIGGTATSSAKLYFEGTTGNASMAGTLTIGQGQTLRPAYGPLQLAYKSGPNAWTTGMVMTESGYVGIGTTDPQYQFVVSGATGGIQLNRTGGNDPFIFLSRDGTSVGQIRGDTTGLSFSNSSGSTDYVRILESSGNVGIGTTAPSATLDIVGNLEVNGYATVSASLALGTANAPAGPGNLAASGYINATRFADVINTAYFLDPGATGFSLTTAGSVGIGTTSPAAKLAINGGLHVGGDSDPGDDNLLVDGTGTVTGLLTANGGITADGGVFTVADTTGAIHTGNNLDVDGVITAGSSPVTLTGATGYILETAITQDSLDDSEIEDNSLTALSLAADSVSDSELDGGFGWTLDTDLNIDANTLVVSYDDDRVGIGTASPTAKLDVAGDASVSGNLYLNANGEIRPMTNGSLSLDYKSGVNAWTPALTVNNLGNVGIGTTSPSQKLQLSNQGWLLIDASGASSTAGINFYETGTISSTDVQYGGKIFYDEASDTLRIVTRENSADKLGITIARASGYVGIGTTGPNYKLDVSGDINFTGALREDGTEILSGMITAFAGDCPTGWTEYTAAQGRTVVGVPSGGTVAGTVGTALTNLENRTHSHTVSGVVAHTHGVGTLAVGSGGAHNHTLNTNTDAPRLASVDATGSWNTNFITAAPAHAHTLSGSTASYGSGYTVGSAGRELAYIQLRYCQKSAGSDLAEWISTNENISEATIVSIDPDNREKVIASRKEYDPTVVGIIATQPGWLLGTENKESVQMALAGRVLARVTLKNGEIKPGDPITTSTILGVGIKATKAGPIVGKAMEALNETSSLTDCYDPTTGRNEKCGTILVFVNISWYDPASDTSQDNLSADANNLFYEPLSFEDDLTNGDLVNLEYRYVPSENDSTKLERVGYIAKAGLSLGNPIGAISTEIGGQGELLRRERINNKIISEIRLIDSGRAEVKIASNSASINPGDPITVSSESGKGIKAFSPGPIIGRALEGWTPESGRDRILTFISPSWYDPDVYLTDTGELKIERLASSESASSSSNYTLYANQLNAFIDRIGAFAQIAVAQLKAGLIQTQELIADSLVVNQKIVSPVVETDQLTANSVNSKQLTADSLDAEESKFGKLLIENEQGETVASIDSAGNASFGGLLAAENLQVEENATIAGTLYANHTSTRLLEVDELRVAGEIVTEKGTFGELLARVENLESSLTVTPQPEADRPLDETLEPIPTPSDTSEVSPTPSAVPSTSEVENLDSTKATNSGLLADSETWPISDPSNDILITNSLTVLGTSSLADTSVAGQLMVDATIIIDREGIQTLPGSTLKLQAYGWGGIDMLDGKVTIDTQGNVLITGDLAVSGDLFASTLHLGGVHLNTSEVTLSGVERGSSDGESGFGKLLAVLNKEGMEVASINASGSAFFAQLGIKADYTATQSGTIIAAAENYAENGYLAPAIKTNATAGIGILPANEEEVMIYNPQVTGESLIYVTATTNTENKVLYVKAKRATQQCSNVAIEQCSNEPGWFIVALNESIAQDVQFNWWIIGGKN